MKRWSADEKMRVVIESLRGASVAGLGRRYGLAPSTIYSWRRVFLEGGVKGLAGAQSPAKRLQKETMILRRTAGEYIIANEILRRAIRESGGKPPA